MMGQFRNSILHKLERIVGLPEHARTPRFRRLMGLGSDRCDLESFRRLGFESLESRTLLSGNLGFAIGGGSALDDAGYDVTTDNAGNVYVTGEFQGTVDFEPGGGVTNLTSTGGFDTFFAKYSSTGSLLWARTMGNTTDNGGRGITVDNAGNVYITGWFDGQIEYDLGFGSVTVSGGGEVGSFVLKLDTNADFVWMRGLSGTDATWINDIAVDDAGNVYTAGTFSGTTDFDPEAGTVSRSAAGSTDAFLSKWDASGAFVWSKTFGGDGNGVFGNGSDRINGLAVDSDGNLLVTGQFEGTVDFDPGSGIRNLTSAGQEDVFVSKFSAAGNSLWARSFGGVGSDVGHGIAVDSFDRVIISGSFENAVDFDSAGDMPGFISSGESDAFVTQLTSGGDFVWARGLGGPGDEVALDVAVDASNNVFLTGEFKSAGSFDIDGDSSTDLDVTSNDGGFVAKFDSSGNFLIAGALGGTGSVSPTAIATDQSGNVYITGSFTSSVDFDPGAGNLILSSEGGTDIFLAQFVSDMPPTTTGIGDVIVDEGAPDTLIDLNAAFNDAENVHTLSYVILNVTNPTLFAGINLDSSNGKLTLDYAAHMSGTSDITVRAIDASGQFVETTFTVTVKARVVEVPTLVATDDFYIVVANLELKITASDLLENDLLGNLTTVSPVVVENPAHGSLTINADGSFRYRPSADFVGVDYFTYRLAGSGVNSPPATVSINVIPPPLVVNEGDSNSPGGIIDVTLPDIKEAVASTPKENPRAPFVYFRTLTETSPSFFFEDFQQKNVNAGRNGQLISGGGTTVALENDTQGNRPGETVQASRSGGGGEELMTEDGTELLRLQALAAPVDDALLLNSAYLEGDESAFVFDRIFEKGATARNLNASEPGDAKIQQGFASENEQQAAQNETESASQFDFDSELFVEPFDDLAQGNDEEATAESFYSLTNVELDQTALVAIATTIMGGGLSRKLKKEHRRSTENQNPLNPSTKKQHDEA